MNGSRAAPTESLRQKRKRKPDETGAGFGEMTRPFNRGIIETQDAGDEMTSGPSTSIEPEKEHGRGAASLGAAKTSRATAAREMLSAFESVGAIGFDLTITDLEQNLIEFRRGHSVKNLSASIPFLLDVADNAARNLIIRPRGKNERQFIQLDDLDGAGIERVRMFAFLIIETSRGNFQVWLSVEDADEDTARQLKKAAGADATASGAARVCGSRNFKAIHSPHSLPSAPLRPIQGELRRKYSYYRAVS